MSNKASSEAIVKDSFYNGAMRARMREFLGGDSLETATCCFMTIGDVVDSYFREHRPVTELPSFWDNGYDISRSLWDRESLLIHLDVEYVNFDFPAEAYLDPERAFDLQRPVEWVIEAALLDYGITPMHLLSGRGHHFIWKISRGSRAFRKLARIGTVPQSLREYYKKPHPPHGERVRLQLANAFAGLGLVMEYLAHRIKEMAAPMCSIPVEITAVEVGPKTHGREMISIDISEYGDPLTARAIRIPFSAYLKPWQQRWLCGEENLEKLPAIFQIPLHEMDSREGVRVMRDTRQVQNLAAQTSVRIPDFTEATENLIKAYAQSSLASFHGWFYSVEQHEPEEWPDTYDRMAQDDLPFCVAHTLQHPNDLLLKPIHIEKLVRVLLALGWHPMHISGLIRSKYERDYQWGEQWNGYVPAARADFYTRLFAGLFATGKDDLVDFNCQSAKDERICLSEHCPDNLECFKKSLLDRRTYERLACRPLNRLFLPEEHLRMPRNHPERRFQHD